MSVGGLRPTHRTVLVLSFRGESMMLYPRLCMDELSGLPSQRVVDFYIELHPSTLAISMTPHRMAPVEL